MHTQRLLVVCGALAALVLALVSIKLVPTRDASANPLGGIVSIAAGEDHTCAIMDTGGVKCWGNNRNGVLGLGSVEARFYTVPHDTVDLGGAAIAIAGGLNHTCVIVDGGSVKCWGPTAFAPGSSSPGVPAAISDLSGGAVALAAGYTHTCALLEGGTVECWGKNSDGQLGSGPVCSIYCSRKIVDVLGISDAIAIAAGSRHSCAVLSTGTVKCWGSNIAGELGDGSGTGSNVAVSVLNISDAIGIAAGDVYTCALTQAGGVKCWGLGYGNEAADVPGLATGVVAISASQSHTCVLMSSGRVKCWGDNAFGELGDGQHCGSVCATPVDVLGLPEGIRSISLGTFHSCAVMNDGTAKCWGFNWAGQLGNGALVNSLIPTDVVVAAIKPTPVPTPCAPKGCPAATPRPAPPQTGLDFSISVDSSGDGVPDCGTGIGEQPVCEMAEGTQFEAFLHLLALPPDLASYSGFESRIAFAGVTSEHKSDIVWPDCGFPATHYDSDFIAFGCASPVGEVTSSYVGALGTSLFTCTASGSITLVLARHEGDEGTVLLEYGQVFYFFEDGAAEQLVINCGDTPLAGDVDCTSLVNSVDAALILQKGADLVDWLDCPQFADVNLDRNADAIDSLLTLQYTAGLIGGLPVFPAGP